MSGRGAHTENISSHPIGVYPLSHENTTYSQYNNSNIILNPFLSFTFVDVIILLKTCKEVLKLRGMEDKLKYHFPTLKP